MDSSTPVYRLLVPLTYDGKREVPTELHDALKDELYVAFNGYTVGGTVEGAYRMDNGQKQIDQSLQIWVAVPDEQIPELDAIIEKYCKIFEQESTYVEKTGGTVRFVRPPRELSISHDQNKRTSEISSRRCKVCRDVGRLVERSLRSL